MKNSYYEIERLLNASIRDAGLPNNVAVGMVGQMLADDKRGKVWLQAHNLRAGTSVATLGSEGEDDLQGILQFNINYMDSDGPGEALKIADLLASYYGAGRLFSYNGSWIRVRFTDLTQPRPANGYLMTSMSVYYYSRRQRNVHD